MTIGTKIVKINKRPRSFIRETRVVGMACGELVFVVVFEGLFADLSSKTQFFLVKFDSTRGWMYLSHRLASI